MEIDFQKYYAIDLLFARKPQHAHKPSGPSRGACSGHRGRRRVRDLIGTAEPDRDSGQRDVAGTHGPDSNGLVGITPRTPPEKEDRGAALRFGNALPNGTPAIRCRLLRPPRAIPACARSRTDGCRVKGALSPPTRRHLRAPACGDRGRRFDPQPFRRASAWADSCSRLE